MSSHYDFLYSRYLLFSASSDVISNAHYSPHETIVRDRYFPIQSGREFAGCYRFKWYTGTDLHQRFEALAFLPFAQMKFLPFLAENIAKVIVKRLAFSLGNKSILTRLSFSQTHVDRASFVSGEPFGARYERRYRTSAPG